MRGISRYLLPVLAAMIMTGCAMRGQEPAPVDQAQNKPEQQEQHQQQQQQQQPQKPPVVTAPQGVVVPAQPGPITHEEDTAGSTHHSGSSASSAPAPRVRHYDWGSAAAPMVNQMLQAGGVNNGSVLLVDSVNNRTNGTLKTSDATNALRGALTNNGKFTLVSAQQLSVAKQSLGLSANDSLGSRTKAMGIARKVGAQYVLYSNATGNVNAPQLQMQLMTVQTGEIVWSGKNAVQQTH